MGRQENNRASQRANPKLKYFFMTYKQAYDKIIEAYFKDEIRPYNGEFCFCGTLGYQCGRLEIWNTSLYAKQDYLRMEFALLSEIKSGTVVDKYGGDVYLQNPDWRYEVERHPNYEAALFSGMSAALDVLKQIHIDRGEIIDEIPEFTKRNICAPKN